MDAAETWLSASSFQPDRLKFFQVQQRQFYDIWKWFEHFRNICSENDTATLFQEVDSSSAFEKEPMLLKMKRNEAEYRCAKQLNLAAQPYVAIMYVSQVDAKGFILPSRLSAKKPDSLGV